MRTVDDYARIRRAYRDGMSLRAIARTFHHSRKTIRKVLRGEGEPKPYPKRQQQTAPKLEEFHDLVLEILEEDETAPPKQRHTRMRIFERLQKEGYSGGYDAVRRFVNRHLKTKAETFIPLDHHPGQRIEADFGEISVDFPEGRRKVNVLILVWSYSNLPFAVALPTQRTEAILEGMTQAFDFFGCVPEEVWWDNPKTVAEALLSGRSRKINPRYQALASHYVFEPLFCMPARGNEKPVVENRVKTLERKWSTPVPRVKDLEELNAYDAGDDVLDPLHYLTTLERRPAALDHANVYRDWKLPKVFGELADAIDIDELQHLAADSDGLEGIRMALRHHAERYAKADVSREVARLHLPHIPYAMFFTGGPSWGDDPTLMFETFAALAEVEPLLAQLEQWAIDDAGIGPPTHQEQSALAVLKEFAEDVRASFGTGIGRAIDEERLDWPDGPNVPSRSAIPRWRRTRTARGGKPVMCATKCTRTRLSR